jgi:hypothetical protein
LCYTLRCLNISRNTQGREGSLSCAKLLIVATTVVVRGRLNTDGSIDVDGRRTVVLVGKVGVDVEGPEPMVIDFVVVGKPNPTTGDVLDATGTVSDTAGGVELI